MKDFKEHLTAHSEVSEKMIEQYLRQSVEGKGGICLKYSNPNMVGYPDRLVILPGGWTAFVELKSKGKKPSRIQAIRLAQLHRLGMHTRVIDSRDGVNDLIETWLENTTYNERMGGGI